MSASRFVGATVRDCLRRVKEVLGPDAVVISNRAVENGVEIIAMSPEGLDAISQQMRPAEKISATPSSAAVSADPPHNPSMAPLVPAQPPAEEGDYTVTLSSVRQEITSRVSCSRGCSSLVSFCFVSQQLGRCQVSQRSLR
jgi:flagellar biosynthesis protein FlhF